MNDGYGRGPGEQRRPGQRDKGRRGSIQGDGDGPQGNDGAHAAALSGGPNVGGSSDLGVGLDPGGNHEDRRANDRREGLADRPGDCGAHLAAAPFLAGFLPDFMPAFFEGGGGIMALRMRPTTLRMNFSNLIRDHSSMEADFISPG